MNRVFTIENIDIELLVKQCSYLQDKQAEAETEKEKDLIEGILNLLEQIREVIEN
jgi:NACalpha-BTF3-like transcription factor